MAYDSDTRVKEKLKSISRKAKLSNLALRIFDESNEDQKHWTEGGLTFGPKSCIYGSNDGGWFIKKLFFINGKKISNYTPVVIVEGSYGTESGNTGSAQYARFSHALGAVIDGFVGVYFLPFKSTYRMGDGKETTAYVRYDMLYAALNASKVEKGEYIFIDAYSPEVLQELLEVLDKGKKSEVEKVINKIKQIMKDFADKHDNTKKRSYLYNNSTVGKLLMFNVVSFSAYNFRTKTKYRAGRFRNGHTIVGDALINFYLNKKPFDLILARFTHDDCVALDRLKQKEWILLRTHKNIRVVTLDDLKFKDRALKKNLYQFLNDLPLLGPSLAKKNELSRKIKAGFRSGEIEIDWNMVKQNAYRTK